MKQEPSQNVPNKLNSTGNTRRIAKKSKPDSPGNGRASRFNGDTGSSSSTRAITSSQGGKNTEQVADQLTALVDSLKMRMESEVKKSSEFKLIEIEARERRRIDEARSEEAWTAKQTLIQAEASAQMKLQQAEVKVNVVEQRASSIIHETAQAETRESQKKKEVIEAANSILTDRERKIAEQEREIQQLKEN